VITLITTSIPELYCKSKGYFETKIRKSPLRLNNLMGIIIIIFAPAIGIKEIDEQ
jgi:hypothetical protein